MALSEFVARRKREIFHALSQHQYPEIGAFDAEVLREGRTKGEVRMGTSVLHPDRIELQFLFGTSDPTILTVTLETPERIVFMPVPDWVVQNVYQGDVLGSAHFESDAQRLLAEFEIKLTPAQNEAEFTKSVSIGRH